MMVITAIFVMKDSTGTLLKGNILQKEILITLGLVGLKQLVKMFWEKV